MNTTSIPPLTIGQFMAPGGLNLSTLGLNPANPNADRVADALAELRKKAVKATKSPMRIRQTVPGLTPAEAKELGACMVSSQFSVGMGINGRKMALEIAVRLADALDAFHGYLDMLLAVELNFDNAASYVDDRCWASTPRHIQNLVKEVAQAEHRAAIKQVRQEIANLTAMLDQVDAIGGVALELFERRRMQRAGVRPRAIDKAISEMKADGRIPMQKGGVPA
jgi:hypothetical protein